MTEERMLTDESREHYLVRPQKEVLEHLFINEHNLIVSAGAGTGKTTTMVEAVTEAVLRENDTENNPFNKILVVTFTVEAARQLKKKIRERIVKHSKSSRLANLDDLVRQIENESWILTLDSFTRRVLNEEMIDAGIGSLDEVTDDFELSRIRKGVLQEIKEDSNFEEDVNTLQGWAPKTWFNRHDNVHWESMIWDALRSGRQLGLSGIELMDQAHRTMKEDLFLGYDPRTDLTEEEKKEIIDNLSWRKEIIQSHKLKDIYSEYEKVLNSFEKILLECEKKYDEISTSAGKLTYDDVRYHIIKHMETDISGEDFRKNRFKYIFVDEFQDTSHAQCDLLKVFISEDTRVVLIGDPRQSIYQWREADPNIFSKMVKTVSCENSTDKVIDKFGVKGFLKVDLDVNFRSNNSIVEIANNLFGENDIDSIFNQDKYCCDIDLPHNNLKTCDDRIKAEENMNGVPLHMYFSDCRWAVDFAEDWAEKICEIISNISVHKIFDKKDDDGNIKFKDALPGDCWILMRSKTKWKYLKDKLNEYNIDYIFVNQKGLFQRSASIQIIIDMLNWIGNPHDFESLARIVRSPLLGVEDRTLRYIASKEFELDWMDKGEIPDFICNRDVKELQELINLREDLRWKREGRKNDLIECILQFSCFDITSISTTEGVQELGNIRQFQQIIDGWEEEQLMSFQEFIDRINYYREVGADEAEFNFAPLAEQEEKDSVKITTVHSSKGLGFPIVFLYNPDRSISDALSFAYGGTNLIIKKKKDDSDKVFVSIGFSILDSVNDKLFSPTWTEINSKIDRFSSNSLNNHTNVFDKNTIFDYWAEEWRLFYVALTRAEDHIFLPVKPGTNDRCSWEKIYNERYRDGSLLKGCNFEDDISIRDYDIGVEELTLPDLEKNTIDNYVPLSISVSHLYDLFVCPRRYQYVQLQYVSGPSDCEGVSRPDGMIFGNELHRAMELNEFRTKENNVHSIRDDMQYEVLEAMDSFYESDIYTEYGFDEHKTLDEEEFSCSLDIKGYEVLLEGKVDCLMKTDDGFVVFDYKTVDPDNRFEKDHQKFQIIGYSYLLNELYPEIGVSKAVLLYYDRKVKAWSKEEVPLSLDVFEKYLHYHIPIELDDHGLKKGDTPPCEDGDDGKRYCSDVIRLCHNV